MVNEHVLKLGLKVFGVGFAVKIVVLFAPVSPAAGKPFYNLFGAAFRPGYHFAICVFNGVAFFVIKRDAGFAEIFGDHDVGGNLGPVFGNFAVFHFKDAFAVWVADDAVTTGIFHIF